MIKGTNVEKIIFERKLQEVTERLRQIEENVKHGTPVLPDPSLKISRFIPTERG
jgi:hypothetical protein